MFALAALAGGSLALADTPAGPPHGGHGGPPIERLASELGLDDNQKAQVQQIIEAQRAKREALETEFRQQLSTVLTADQLKKFDDMRQRRPPGPPRGE